MGGNCRPLYCVCGITIPQRLLIIFICISGVFIARLQRSITNYTHTICKINPINNCTYIIDDLRWDFRNITEAYDRVLAVYGYHFGHFVFQVPAGILIDKYSVKWFYIGGILISSGLTLLIPVTLNNEIHWTIHLLMRMFIGTAHSVVFPSVSVLIARWVPPKERGLLGTLCFASYPISFFIAERLRISVLLSYISGGLGLFWCSFSVFFLYENHSIHPHLMEKEMKLLAEEMPQFAKLKIQCKKILHSKGIWALILGQIGHLLFIHSMLQFSLVYEDRLNNMNQVEHLILFTCCFTGLWISACISGFIVDYGIAKKSWNIKWSRRMMVYVSFLASSTCFSISAYVTSNKYAMMVTLWAAIFLKGPYYASHRINHMDLNVNFNGVVMATLNFAGDISLHITETCGLRPIPSSRAVKDFRNDVWYILALTAISTTCYVLMAKSNREDWDMSLEPLDEA